MNSDDEAIVDAGARTPPQGSSVADGHDHPRTEEVLKITEWREFLHPKFFDQCTARRVVVKKKRAESWVWDDPHRDTKSDIPAPNLEELRVSFNSDHFSSASTTLLRIRAPNLQVLEVPTCREVWSACQAGHLRSLQRLIVRRYPYFPDPVYAKVDEVIGGLQCLPNLTHLELPSPLARRVASQEGVAAPGVADLPNLVHVKIFAEKVPYNLHAQCEAFLRHIEIPPTTTIDLTDMDVLHMDKPAAFLINRIVGDKKLSFHTLVAQMLLHRHGGRTAIFEAYAMKGPPRLRMHLDMLDSQLRDTLAASTASFREFSTLELVFSAEDCQLPAAEYFTGEVVVSLMGALPNVTHLRLRLGQFEDDESIIRQACTILPQLKRITVCDVSPSYRVARCTGRRERWDIPPHSEDHPCVIPVTVIHCDGLCKTHWQTLGMPRGVFSNGRMGDAAKLLL